MITISQQMQQAIELGLASLDNKHKTLDYIAGQLNNDGGFKNRQGQSDIYYSVFGLTLNAASKLQLSINTEFYLACQPNDLVGLSSLARCLKYLNLTLRNETIEQYRAKDGGYNQFPASEFGSIYGCFLALGFYQDTNKTIPNPQEIVQCIMNLKTPDDGFVNDKMIPIAAVPSTAAAVMILSSLNHIAPANCAQALMTCYQEEGFSAVSILPQPDVLSTAVALLALKNLGYDLHPLAPKTRNFILGLIQDDGSFAANADEPLSDCEYTFYALAALGCLV